MTDNSEILTRLDRIIESLDSTNDRLLLLERQAQERGRGEVKDLKHEVANLEHTQIFMQAVTRHCQECQEATTEALAELDKKYTDSNELVASLRRKLLKMLDDQMALKEELIRAEYNQARGRG